MKKPRTIASGAGAASPLEFCHADSTGAGLTGAHVGPLDPLRQRGPFISVQVPIRTVNSTNAREHWATKAKRAKNEREEVFYALFQRHRSMFGGGPIRVSLTRIGPNNRAMDSDGLQAALKHVRDEVAKFLCLDDASPLITWNYWQERAREYAVRIEITQGEGHG